MIIYEIKNYILPWRYKEYLHDTTDIFTMIDKVYNMFFLKYIQTFTHYVFHLYFNTSGCYSNSYLNNFFIVFVMIYDLFPTYAKMVKCVMCDVSLIMPNHGVGAKAVDKIKDHYITNA